MRFGGTYYCGRCGRLQKAGHFHQESCKTRDIRVGQTWQTKVRDIKVVKVYNGYVECVDAETGKDPILSKTEEFINVFK